MKSKRQSLAKLYTSKIKEKVKSLSLLEHDYNKIVPHIFVVILPKNTDRAKLQKSLDKLGIPTGIHYKPNHLLTYFKNDKNVNFKNTDLIYPRLLTLPLHPHLEETEINFIVDALSKQLPDEK